MKKSLVLIGILFHIFAFFVAPALCEPPDKSGIADLFTQANDMFRQADKLITSDPEAAKDLYLKSAMRFEKIVKHGGIHNGKLYYNIANAYFRINDIGRAILNYRRAMQYIPNNPNLRQNLEYARAMRLDKIDEAQKTKVFRTLFFWHYDLSVKIRIIIFTVFFLSLWTLASIRLFFKKPFLKWCMAFSLGLSLLFTVSLAVDAVSLQKISHGVIIDSEIIARKGNGETYEPAFKEPLHAGTEFTLIEDRGKWFHIKLPDSRTCWVPAISVELVNPIGISGGHSPPR
ncbi:MAG: hypothetical protein GY864_02295 [Desulfobacterales bacterium]|nr:hypothetical protein [Desulfobacterales bacterium]